MKSVLSLLACLCLSGMSFRASAQAKPLGKLPPKIVRLDSGSVALQSYAAFTKEAYDQYQAERADAESLLLIRAGRIQNLLLTRRADSLSLVAYGNEIRRLREQLALTNRNLTKQELAYEKLLSRPLQKPLLLDGHFYKGLVSGYFAGLLTGFRFHP